MPRFRNYQTNFSGGLLSEGMLGRVELAQYENGCKQLTNWWPKTTGGMRRRPGSLYLTDIEYGIRLESFIFSEEQTYLVVFCYSGTNSNDSQIKIFDKDTGAEIDSVLHSYNSTEINELSITQKGDVMIVVHEDHQPRLLTRLSATTFSWSVFRFEGKPPLGAYPKKMPFFKFEDTDVTITVNGYQQGTQVTVTATEPVFYEALAGHAIRYRGKQLYVTSTNVTASQQYTCIATVIEELDKGQKLWFNASNDDPHDFIEGEIIVGRDSGIKAEVIETSDDFIIIATIAGSFFPNTVIGEREEVEGLTSGNIARITLVHSIDPPASADWDEEAFSQYRGWPSVVAFHSQRLWFGGSSSLPAHIFGSRVAAFFNFDVGDALPADSIQVAISSNKINKITNIVSGRHLQIFTDAGEFYAPQSEDRPLVPETFDLLKQTNYGSQRESARVFDESTLFIQAQGSAIREFIWQDRQRGYSADAISLIAEEYINDIQEVEILYGGYDRPEQMAFFVNADGTITWYHAARSEQIRTWGIWTTSGNYKSLTVLQDKLYAMVERTTNSGTKLFLECFELNLTMDCVKHSTDTAKSIWTNATLTDFEGITLQVTNGVTAPDPDYYLGEYVVTTNGTVDVSPISVDNISVGFGFTQTLETMPIEVKDQNGLTTGMPKRLVSADLYMASTLAAELEGNMVLTYLRENDLTQKPTPITGVRKFYLLGYDERPTLIVENKVPVPCEVLSLGAEVEY